MAPFCASLTLPLPSASLRALSFLLLWRTSLCPISGGGETLLPFIFSPSPLLSSPLLQTKTFSGVLLYHSEIPNPTWLAGANSPNLIPFFCGDMYLVQINSDSNWGTWGENLRRMMPRLLRNTHS